MCNDARARLFAAFDSGCYFLHAQACARARARSLFRSVAIFCYFVCAFLLARSSPSSARRRLTADARLHAISSARSRLSQTVVVATLVAAATTAETIVAAATAAAAAAVAAMASGVLAFACKRFLEEKSLRARTRSQPLYFHHHRRRRRRRRLVPLIWRKKTNLNAGKRNEQLNACARALQSRLSTHTNAAF